MFYPDENDGEGCLGPLLWSVSILLATFLGYHLITNSVACRLGSTPEACGDEIGLGVTAVIMGAGIGIGGREFLVWTKRPGVDKAPSPVAIVGEMQILVVTATAVCLFRITEIFGNFVAAFVVSMLPALWAIFATGRLWDGVRTGWFASILGNIICLGLVVWAGPRNPIALAIVSIVVGTPLLLLCMPKVVRFYLRSDRGRSLEEAN